MYVCIYVCMYTYVCMYVCMYVYMYMYMYIYIRTYIHIGDSAVPADTAYTIPFFADQLALLLASLNLRGQVRNTSGTL
jgi:hypothetical protein